MSYDLFLFQPDLRTSLKATVEELFSDLLEYKREREDVDFSIPSAGPNHGSLQPELEQRKQHLARALIASDPKLTMEPLIQATDSNTESLERLGISMGEAKRIWRTLELYAPQEDSGIIIYLMDITAHVAVPYWHHGPAAYNAMKDAWGYLAILQNEASYQIYDPQRDSLLDLDEGFRDVLAKYQTLVRVAERGFGDAFEWRRQILGVTPSK